MSGNVTQPQKFHSLRLAKWLWRDYFRKYLKWILLAAFLMAIEGSVLGLISYMIKPMFDEIFRRRKLIVTAWSTRIRSKTELAKGSGSSCPL